MDNFRNGEGACLGVCVYVCVCVCLVTQLCLTLCDTMDCSPPGSSVHAVLQARILEWVAIPFSGGVFSTQGLNLGLPHCREILYHLSHQGSPGLDKEHIKSHRWGFIRPAYELHPLKPTMTPIHMQITS